MVGLTDEKRGRRGRVKLTEEDVTWVEARAAEAPEFSGRALAEELFDERGVAVLFQYSNEFSCGCPVVVA
ncbi:MAG: helix-turn-helix domain-containing protein [Gemmatimonadetes bacterium]|nr:helix-turn-helix domain-containing protein [Gemmatimonadota bacterium]